MAKNQSFPIPGCSSCPHYEVVGGLTRYCSGFKRRKPKRFKSSDPRLKVPKWCPRRISPPIYRIYSFTDDRSEYMELIRRMDYEAGRSKLLSPSPSHYKPRAELPLGKTAKQFYLAAQEEPLSNILPVKVETGEIIEIDDGLQPYYFYLLDYATVIPLPYQIKTFWEQNKIATEKKVDMIKLYLTPEERQKIHQAAQKLGFRYDNHFVKFCIEQTLKKQ